VDFYTSCINGKTSECSTEKLQSLQLQLNFTLTLLDKNKKHKMVRFEVSCQLPQYFIQQQE